MKKIALISLLVFGIVAGTGTASTDRASAPEGKRKTLVARDSAYGKILFDGRGFVLYAFTKDPRGGKSKCYGECAQAWPVYYKQKRKIRAGKGVRRKLIGTVKRRNGKRQITYNGRPLYYYVGDDSPGEVSCQNVFEFGGKWLVVKPNGKLVR